MSQYVVHFTDKPHVFAEILATGHLRASGPFGFSWARKHDKVQKFHYSGCFSEVPLDSTQRIMRRHGSFGVAFTKDFIRRRQGARVWYVDQGSTQARRLNEHLSELTAAQDFVHPMWSLTPFIDLVMPGKYEWDWEREWRVQGDIRFTLEDVAFVITPEGFEELPALNGLYVHPKHDLIITASPQALVEYIEDRIQQFFQTFEDPANRLPVDGGEYVWVVDEWETEDALAEVFPELSDEVHEKLVTYLQGISWSWVLSETVASIYE